MYPNFPRQVMEASDAELFINAVMHYLGDVCGLRILPEYVKENREELDDISSLKIIELGSIDDYANHMTNVIRSNTEFTPDQRDEVKSFFGYSKVLFKHSLPVNFTNKENMCFVSGLLWENTQASIKAVSGFTKTATDVLRVAVAISDGDISLAEKTKFKNFKAFERRALLQLLNGVKSPLEDMNRYREMWLRLGERIHPGTYKTRYKKAFKAFDVLRNDATSIKSFNSDVERYIKNGEIDNAVRALSSRPGEFARRLNQLLSKSSPQQTSRVLSKFEDVAPQVSEKVLLGIQSYFSQRNVLADGNFRLFYPKGQTAKSFIIEDDRTPIAQNAIDSLLEIIESALLKQYSDFDELGNVYIDPTLEKYYLPSGNRSSSSSLMKLTRGTRVPLNENASTIRLFCWWKDISSGFYRRVDIDLSASYYDSDWKFISQVSYTNLRSSKVKSYHSGDITSAPNGACEFIDIDIKSTSTNNARYVVYQVYSFTRQPMSQIPELKVGWMERKSPNSGEIFEPKTVTDVFELDSNAQNVIPVVFDLETREVVIADTILGNNGFSNRNFEANADKVVALGKSVTDMKRPNMFNLIKLHAIARGNLVSDPDEADVVCDISAGFRPEHYDFLTTKK